MDSIIAAASVIAAGLSIGLSAIGPGIGQVTLLVKLLKVLLVNLKQKQNPWYIIIKFSFHGSINYLRSSCSVSIIIR
jgi:F0F1-type ATP synthase membrane subunit c/vacuolar-type H+-ATPase subunit K